MGKRDKNNNSVGGYLQGQGRSQGQSSSRTGRPLFDYENGDIPIRRQTDYGDNAEYTHNGSHRANSKIKANDKKTVKDKGGERSSVSKMILLGVGSFFLVLTIGIIGIFIYYFGGLRSEGINKSGLEIASEKHSQLESEAGFEGDAIVNIALFGIDTKGSVGRSDAIMILSVNRQTNAIKLISLQRDSYVPIRGSKDKLGHAYAYGGPELAIKTINETFSMDIADYVTVNFSQLAQVVDAIGGVNIDVTSAERYYLNQALAELYFGKYRLDETGFIELNGPQAVAYARIRKLDGDKARTGRQREVIMAIFEKVKSMKVTEYPALARMLLPMVATSFTYADIMEYLPVLTSGKIKIEETSIPGNYDKATDLSINGISYLGYDLELATQHIHDFIYKGIDPDVPPVQSGSSSGS